MNLIVKKRVLRPSTRLASSKSYKINTEKVSENDILHVEISHETNPEIVLFKYEFSGSDVANRNSIHFKAEQKDEGWIITWSGASPVRRLI